MPSADSREYLATNNAVDGSITNHQNDVEESADLRRIEAHEKSIDDLSDAPDQFESEVRVLIRTIVRFPLTAPHVLMYAVVREPRNTPTTAQAALSAKPNPKTMLQVMATAMLLMVRFALSHRRNICTKPIADNGKRSSTGTRSRPRASNPAMSSIRWFSLLKEVILAALESTSGSD